MCCEQTCPSPAKTSWTDLGLSKIQLGMVFSAFAWGYAIFQFPGGVFGDIVGSRRALSFIAVLWGILTLATGLVPGTAVASTTFILATLIGLRFLDWRRASTIVSGVRRWNDRKMVPGVGVGIPERIDEHRADPGRRRDRTAGCLADGKTGVA